MKWMIWLLLIFLSGALPAQEEAPRLLLQTAHCLATESQDWLGLAHQEPKDLELGFLSDPNSLPGDDLLYIVSYANPLHTEGTIFTVLVSGKDSRRVVDVRYKVRFQQAADGSQQVQLLDPPLGGIGSQDHMTAAVQKIGFQTFTIPVAELLRRNQSVQCESQGV